MSSFLTFFKPKATAHPEFTGLRAVAAFMVFLHHFPPPAEAVGLLLHRMCREMHIGVGLFFVLSGFLIYLTYAETAQADRRFFFPYFRKRFARIYPVFFLVVVGTSLYGLWGVTGGRDWLREGVHLGLHLTFLKGFFDKYKFLGLPQTWTLTVEETFYCLFPLVVLGIRRFGFLKTLGLVYGLGLVLLGGGTLVGRSGLFSPPFFVWYYTFFGRATEFFIGMYVAHLVRTNRLHHSNAPVAFRTWSGVAAITLVLVVFAVFVSPTHEYGVLHPVNLAINNLVLPVGVAILFCGFLTESSLLKKLLGHPAAVLLGQSSYVFYLIQIGPIQRMVKTYLTKNNFVLFLVLNVVSLAVFWSIEEPLRRWLREKH